MQWMIPTLCFVVFLLLESMLLYGMYKVFVTD